VAEVATPSAPAGLEAPTTDRPAWVRAMGLLDRFGVLLLVAVMVGLSILAQPDFFLTERNIFNIFRQNAFYFMLALGQFIVIVTAGIDLSVGSTLALSMMTAAVLSTHGVPWPLLILTPFLVGATVGLFNGLGLTRLHLPHPFIMTLGMMFIARGATNIISGGVPIAGLPAEVRWIGYGNIGGTQVPVSLIAVAVTYTLAWVFLQHTRTGRHIFAIGGSTQAARVSGVSVNRTLVIAYVLCGLLAGFAGLIVAGRTGSGFPNAGEGDELFAISAVIIGGASFFGGRGTVIGVFAGVLVIGLLRNLLNLNNVQAWWQQVLIGVIIIGVVSFDVLRRRIASSG
jgi:ribose transport system permease protein